MPTGRDQNGKENTANSLKMQALLSEELQRVTARLAEAGSESDALDGLERLKRLSAELGASGCGADARREMEALIDRAEASLEKVLTVLARKRRLQEGDAMERIAARREAETDIMGTLKAAAETGACIPPGGASPASEEEKTVEASPPPAHGPAPNEPEKSPAADPDANDAASPAPPVKEAPKPEWSRAYRIVAHMAASVTEDRKFFEKLRKSAVKPGKALPAPADHAQAEKHFRAVHGLNVRLINIELKIKAIAAAYKNNRPVSDLFLTASNEIKGFMRDYKARMDEMPDMCAEYERQFGGYAERFASLPAPKGGKLLARCLLEQRNEAPAACPDGAQRVLRRDYR